MFQRMYFQKSMIGDLVSSKTDLEAMWNSIDWAYVRESVFRQQCEIARAAEEERTSDIRRLQDELTGSDEAKALAVRDVMQKKSRNTPGVDGVLWKTPAEMMYAAIHLNEDGYEALPLRRFYIPKESGKLRPIGIPSMNDRAMQMLYSFTLQPVAETWGDPHSFGYRLYRSAKDACSSIRKFLCEEKGEVWVLDADITGCFDNIRHDWLLKHIPVSREYLRQVLKSGCIYCGRYSRTSRGVPQGGIISPILANMTLDGMEPRLMDTFSRPDDNPEEPKATGSRLQFVRYADDFIVLSSSRSVVEDAWDETNAFLKPRGLCLSEEKTRVVSIRDGFDFLHWLFRNDGSGISVRPSESSVRHIHQTLKDLFGRKQFSTPDDLIRLLNPLLHGYAFYHRDIESGELFRSLDACIRQKISGLLRDWFPDESMASRGKMFFSSIDQDLLQFHTETQKLYLLSTTPLHPHTMARTDLNAFLDRDRFIHSIQDEDSLERAVYRERRKGKRVGRHYAVQEYG